MTEVVIVDAVRSPIGRHGGALAGVRPDDLLAVVFQALVQRVGLDPALIEDVYAGCVNQAGEDNRDVARMALLLAGTALVAYQRTEIPDPNAEFLTQTNRILYSDGETELGQLSVQQRTSIDSVGCGGRQTVSR